MPVSVSPELIGDARLLPAPHTAIEKAAIEAALMAPRPRPVMTRSRALMGTAALAVAVAVPNLSLEAMVAPFADVLDDTAPASEQDVAEAPSVSTPRAAGGSVPRLAYIPTVTSDGLTEAATTYSSRSNFGDFGRDLPLSFRTDAETFDLAFADVGVPVAATASIAAALKDQPVAIAQGPADAIRTRSVFIDQVADRPLVARLASGSAREVRAASQAGADYTRIDAISDGSFETAFAALVDPAGQETAPGLAAIAQISAPSEPRPNTPEPQPGPQREAVALIAPAQQRPSEVSANAAAQTALVTNLRLDGQTDVTVFQPSFREEAPTKDDANPATARPAFSPPTQPAPVAVAQSGTQRFDIAFAAFDAVAPVAVAASARLPEAPTQKIDATTPALRAHLVTVEQISGRPLVARAAPQEAREVSATLSAQSATSRSDALSNELVETAFAGVTGATRDLRGSLPRETVRRRNIPAPSAPEPRRENVARAIPIPDPDPDLSARAAAQAVLVPKSKLDARVNGVLTGTVDFRQLNGTIAIRLRSVADMLRNRFSAEEFSTLIRGDAIDTFVPIERLQQIGVPISYNPAYDEVEFGIDYKDAPHAAKVQVEQIGSPQVGQQRTAIDQIPRR